MIKFAKYHGCGNSFIIVDYSDVSDLDFSKLACFLCDKDQSIGADGLVIVKEDPLEMIFYNQDGSRSPMCGNGIRCFAAYLYERGKQKEFMVKTLAGDLQVNISNQLDFQTKVNMGKASYDAKLLKLAKNIALIKDYEIEVEQEKYTMNSVFMGTIHTVIIVPCLTKVDAEMVGKIICNHSLFQEKTNVNFVEIIDKNNIKVVTYERGVGITKACGTGCCASVVIAHQQNKCHSEVLVHLELGTLKISLIEEEVFMEGPAIKVAEGMCKTYKEEVSC